MFYHRVETRVEEELNSGIQCRKDANTQTGAFSRDDLAQTDMCIPG